MALCEDPYAALAGADVVVIVTDWDEFRALDLKRVKDLIGDKVCLYLRNISDPDELRLMGFKYVSLGRA